jgi:hypothetical protein
LKSGFCNPKEMTTILRRGAKVWTRNGFHGKVYLSGGCAIIGSANASANGLGNEGEKVDLGLEAVIATDDGAIVRASHDWFNVQLNHADPVDETLIQKYRPTWLARQKGSLSGKTLVGVLDEEPDELKKLSVRLLVYEHRDLTKSQKAAYERLGPKLYGPMFKKFAEREIYPFYIDEQGTWKVAPGDFFLDYTIDPKSKALSFDGIWQALQNTADWQVPIKPGSKGTVTFLREHQNSVGELEFKSKDQARLLRRMKAYLKEHPIESHPDRAIDVPIYSAKWLQAPQVAKR